MLTNETKRKAEAIRQDVADILGACSLMAKVWEKKGEEYRKARALWEVWQYKGERRLHDCGDLTPKEREEETQKAKESRENTPREWSAKVEELSNKAEAGRIALYVARVNFQNYINYCAEMVAELVRPFWQGFALRQGVKDLGEILTPEYGEKDRDTSHAFRVWFNISGGNVGARLFPSSFIRLDTHINPRGVACGIFGDCEGVKMGGDIPNTPREVKAPHLLTVAEYVRAVAKLEQLKNKAEKVASECAKESRELVRSLGLYGFAEFVSAYKIYFEK
jgi:hypothetical protein